ncbi:DUF4386 family protein [Tabrizicola sp.]|uniref:DUF4386 family protein n=1 Tax=Tabrizicola sp. TaxID=2005166 RepID=UPI00286AF089|nr:DUF4386 family protein [Tabrizicola sp.]
MTTLVKAPAAPALGIAMIALAVGFNLPFARLAAVFDYPDILRRPAEEVLAAFVAGGPSLILTWHAFALAALLFLPVGMAHALGLGRVAAQPVLAIIAAVAAALAGLTQAMGLLRWVMVVPGLAATNDVAGFSLIHAYAGVALGEHLGQLLTALYVGLVAVMQWREGRRVLVAIGGLATGAITIGAFEGVALAIGRDGAVFGLIAVAGYLLLTVWMIGSGVTMFSGRKTRVAAV